MARSLHTILRLGTCEIQARELTAQNDGGGESAPDRRTVKFGALLLGLLLLPWFSHALAFAPPEPTKPAEKEAPPKPVAGAPVPLNKQQTVLLDKAGGKLILQTKVCLREGALEMLCCRKGTKEHEAVLAVDTDAFVVHTGLLALGAKIGAPAQFDPDYRAPSGQKIDIFLSWTDAEGKSHREPAQKWIRFLTKKFYTASPYELPSGLTLAKTIDLKYDRNRKELFFYGPMTAKQRDEYLKLSSDATFQKHVKDFYAGGQYRPMVADWVFSGSGFYTDPDTGKKFYLAEDGDLICVANFSSATLDVAIQSSSEGTENLLFEAWTERIPPVGTVVKMELIPVPQAPEKPQLPPAK